MKTINTESYPVAYFLLPYDHKNYFNVYKSDILGYLFTPINLASCLGTEYPADNVFTNIIRRIGVFNSGKSALHHECNLYSLTELVTMYIDWLSEGDDKAIASEFNVWAKGKIEPFFFADESPVKVKEPTERELLEKLAEVVDVRAEDLLNAILHLREENFSERQADLKEILS